MTAEAAEGPEQPALRAERRGQHPQGEAVEAASVTAAKEYAHEEPADVTGSFVLHEPPWYGTVCPVVWEDGGSNPASYPIRPPFGFARTLPPRRQEREPSRERDGGRRSGERRYRRPHSPLEGARHYTDGSGPARRRAHNLENNAQSWDSLKLPLRCSPQSVKAFNHSIGRTGCRIVP